MEALIGEIRPDLIFHVASQRDPGLAQTQVHHTVTTNVLGTRSVLGAAAAAGTGQVVCASTGKALRPFSPDVYTASKRVAEWVAFGFAASGALPVSAVRFTHVVDNSIIHQRLRDWAASSAVIRLHSPQIAFYVQSAVESAQLLMLAALDKGRTRPAGCRYVPSPTWAGRSASSTSPSACWPRGIPAPPSTSAGTTQATKRCRSPGCTIRRPPGI